MRSLLIAPALLLAFLAGSANAEGVYQRTTDNKTMVWNGFPQRGETMSWSGKQDKEDYATGYGELAFHKKTGFTFARHDVVTERYSGKMVRGKLEGTFETVTKTGEKRHATFAGGKRTGDWEPGPAPKAAEKTVANRASGAEVPPQPPAEGPPAGAKTEKPKQSEPDSQSAEKPAAKENESPSHESLRSLAAPPASLQAAGSPASTPPSRLTTPEVIGLADSAARANGYKLLEFENPRAQYNSAADMWSVSYDKKSSAGASEAPKRFSVRIDDKSERTTIVTDK